jgi:cytochrome bd-type quinol oxidase subunit 2
MSPIIKASALVAASLFCLYGFAWLAFSKGVHISEAADKTVAAVFLISAVLLPIIAFLFLRAQRGTPSYRLMFPAFLVALAPAVILLCALLVVLLVRRPD